jgi:hypothetical protein
MLRTFITIAFSGIISLSFIFSPGCAKPPMQEIENAEHALSQAKKKEADRYMQEDYRKAEDALKRAKSLVLQKKYKEAKSAAEQAVAVALQAISRVDMHRTKMGEEVDQMILEGRKFLEEIKTLAVSAIRKKAGVGREKIEAAIGRYELEMVEIKEQRQALQIRDASDRLSSLHTAMKTMKEEITAAIEAKDAAKKQ